MFEDQLAYADRRLNDAAENGTALDCAYWRGYRDALRSHTFSRGEGAPQGRMRDPSPEVSRR